MVTGVNLRRDRKTNQPRGFGFVTFVDKSAAHAAVSSMHGKLFQGRALTVNQADARGSSNDNSKDNHDEEEWKTAPPSRKKKDKNAGDQSRKSGANSKDNKKSVRSWDQWAAPTAKTVQKAAPQTIPLKSPEEKES